MKQVFLATALVCTLGVLMVSCSGKGGSGGKEDGPLWPFDYSSPTGNEQTPVDNIEPIATPKPTEK